jgi:hypothetical protein
VAFAAGSALAAAGVTLLVLGPGGRREARLDVRPTWGGLALGGSF